MLAIYFAASILLLPAAAAQNATCYYPDGSQATNYNYVSCVGVSHSSCCIPDEGDLCLSNGLCYWPSGGYPFRGACTDKTWKDPACADICQKINPSTWTSLESCGINMFCCKSPSADSCCLDAASIFTFDSSSSIPGPYPADPSYLSVLTASRTYQKDVASKTASPATTTPSMTSTGHLQPTGKSTPFAFIFLIIAVISCALLFALLILVFLKKRKRGRANKDGKEGCESIPGIGQRRGISAPLMMNQTPEPQGGQQHHPNHHEQYYQDYALKTYYEAPSVAPYSPIVSPPPAYQPLQVPQVPQAMELDSRGIGMARGSGMVGMARGSGMVGATRGNGMIYEMGQ